MEEHTKTEHLLELNEEQLQAITGGVSPFDKRTARHLRQASEDIRMADLAKAHGLHDIGEGFAELVTKHLNVINKHLEKDLSRRMNPKR